MLLNIYQFVVWSQMEKKTNKKTTQTVGIVHKFNRQITERDKIDSPNTYTWPLTFQSWYRNVNEKWRVKLALELKYPFLQTYKIIHGRSPSYCGTETSIKNNEVKLDLRLRSPLLQTWCGHESLLQTLAHDRVNIVVLNKNALILNILHSIFQLTMVQTLISTVRVVNV